MRTSWEDWVEWKEKCAVDLCGEEVKDRLVRFVGPQLINQFKRVCPGRQLPTVDSREDGTAARSGFHFFETYMHCTSGNTGKRWKDWLFERSKINVSDPPHVAVEKQVSATLKNAVLRMMTEGEENEDQAARGKKSDHTSDEQKACGAISLQSSGGHDDGSGEGGELFDFLEDLASPDPADEAALRELIEIGREEARKYVEDMPGDERVAVLASVLGISLAHPSIQTVATKSKSMLYDLVNLKKAEQDRLGRTFCTAQWRLFRDKIGRRWPLEDARTLDLLADAFVQALGEEILAWGKSEKSLKVLFDLEKGEPTS